MTVLVQILHNVHSLLLSHFWFLWLALTALAVLGAAWAVGQAPRGAGGYGGNHVLVRRRIRTPGGIWALALLAVFLAFYIVMILVWEDFTYHDNSYFTLGTLRGHHIPPIIWVDWGRFCPLGLQEFNLVRHFTDTAAGYHILPIVQLLIFTGVLLILDDELGIVARTALAVLALLTPSILISFTGLIFFERDELFFLVLLVLSVKRFEQTESTGWVVAAIVCAQFMLYFKETAFLLLLGLAVGRLVLRWAEGRAAGRDFHRLWDKAGCLDLCLTGLAVLFLLFYVSAMGLHTNLRYAMLKESVVRTFLAYLKLDLLAWLLVAVTLGRVYLIFRRREVPLPLWDGLALGGVACFFAYLYLRLFSGYYLAPVDLIAVLYVGRFAVLSTRKISSWQTAAALVLAFIVLLQSVFFSNLFLFERKNTIHADVAIANVIGTRYRIRSRKPLRLYFPFANMYDLTEFAAYLSFRGIPIEGTEVQHPNHVVLVTAAIAADGPCVSYKSIICQAATRPAPGDLVIVLPNDEAERSQAAAYRDHGQALLSYAPRPPIPHSFYRFADLVTVSRFALFEDKPVPDRWMDASVTLWK